MTSFALALPPASAGGTGGQQIRYTDTGTDPDDVPVDDTSCCQQDPDIRSSTRKVWLDEQDRKWLTVSVTAYEGFLGYWEIRVPLDTRAGSLSDARMVIFDTGTDEAGCLFRRDGSSVRDGGFRFVDFDTVRCRVPLRWAEPRKRIRWRLFSAGGGEGTGPVVDEYAPDSGWYV